MKENNKGAKEAIAIVLSLALIFAGCVHLSDLSRLRLDLIFFGAGWGGFVGFASLPYFDKKYRERPFVCAVLAALLATLGAIWAGAGLSVVAIVAVSSACLGFFAPKWVKHVQF